MRDKVSLPASIYRPGEAVQVHAFRRDELLVLNMSLAAPPTDTCVLIANDERAAAALRPPRPPR
ncbi:MAG: hypothetical protein ACT4PQ_05790 [Betaproteobacteria bacterium]